MSVVEEAMRMLEAENEASENTVPDVPDVDAIQEAEQSEVNDTKEETKVEEVLPLSDVMFVHRDGSAQFRIIMGLLGLAGARSVRVPVVTDTTHDEVVAFLKEHERTKVHIDESTLPLADLAKLLSVYEVHFHYGTNVTEESLNAVRKVLESTLEDSARMEHFHCHEITDGNQYAHYLTAFPDVDLKQHFADAGMYNLVLQNQQVQNVLQTIYHAESPYVPMPTFLARRVLGIKTPSELDDLIQAYTVAALTRHNVNWSKITPSFAACDYQYIDVLDCIRRYLSTTDADKNLVNKDVRSFLVMQRSYSEVNDAKKGKGTVFQFVHIGPEGNDRIAEECQKVYQNVSVSRNGNEINVNGFSEGTQDDCVRQFTELLRSIAKGKAKSE